MVAKPTDESAGRSKAIIVLGMHRSGTSAMSGLLHIMGVDLGPDLMEPQPDNPKGFWEHNEIVAVHEQLLAALNLVWDDLDPFPDNWWKDRSVRPYRDKIAEIIHRDFSRSELWGIKDPRMCRLMPMWLEILDEMECKAQFVHMVRNPAEVAESLRKRNGISRRKSILLWMLHELEAEHWSRDYPRIFISFRQLLSSWPSTLEKISEGLGIKFPRKISDVVDKASDFLDMELKHHDKTEDLWSYDPDTPHCVLKAYSDFESAVDGVGKDFVTSLSECRSEFENSMLSYPSRVLMEDIKEQRLAMKATQASLNARISELEDAVRDRDERIKVLASQTESLTTEMGLRDQVIQSQTLALEKFSSEKEAWDSQAKEYELRIGQLLTSDKELRNEVQRNASQKEKWEAKANAGELRISELAELIEAQKRAIAMLNSEKEAWDAQAKEHGRRFQGLLKANDAQKNAIDWLTEQKQAWEDEALSKANRIDELILAAEKQNNAIEWLSSQKDAWEAEANLRATKIDELVAAVDAQKNAIDWLTERPLQVQMAEENRGGWRSKSAAPVG